jgi:tripartite-type tricarboxylate transporter receptor subunit TctC
VPRFLPFLIYCITIIFSLHANAADNIVLKIGYSPGGGYDTVGRLVGRHLGRFLPGHPSIAVQNVPGGGSLKLTKLMVGAEPADGSVVAIVNASNATATVFDPKKADFDATAIKWVGALDNDVSYCYVGANTNIRSAQEFLTKSFKIGATGRTSETYLFAALVKNLFNANIDIVVGFEGGSEIDLAVERGEISGRCGNSRSSLMARDRYGKVRLTGFWAHSDFDETGEVPDLLSMIDNDLDKQAARLVVGALRVHYPILLPPETPGEVVETYRTAFAGMVEDAAFLEDAKKLNLEIKPTGGAEVAGILQGLLTVDQAIINRAMELVR